MTFKLPAFLKGYRLFQIFILGIISGMPFSILYTSLIAYLKDYEIDLSIITTFAIARLPYSLKIFWSPLIDYFSLPILSKFGHRKSWMLLSSITICCILIAISGIDPKESIVHLRFLALGLGIMAATYDISYDALRIEMLDENEQGIGAANAVPAYRVGAYITGGLALYVAGVSEDWRLTFLLMAGLFALGALFIMSVREGAKAISPEATESLKSKIKQFVVMPFMDIITRNHALVMLLAIVLYKLGEAMLGFVTVPFCMEIGYSKTQIGVVLKGYGLIASLCGGYAGGLLLYRIGNINGMICCGVLQAASNLMYLWLHYQPVLDSSLLTAVAIDNFTGAMGSTALVAYLSILCNKNYTATQYAFLSGLATIMNNTLSMQAGSIIQFMGWDHFFYLTAFLEIPSLALLLYIGRRISKVSK
ncbi:MAG: MFS transporter [Pseudomonadota bacterium]